MFTRSTVRRTIRALLVVAGFLGAFILDYLFASLCASVAAGLAMLPMVALGAPPEPTVLAGGLVYVAAWFAVFLRD